ncbi:hypothetical protein RU07_02090 [Agrobacterium tumefaciens]|uniref:DUF6950 domain-containing protein n=1 Tax=Agrobacterium tumefaciens TaxID=358 RepID=A0A0D0KYC1_AGRTU|nr:hypothetical protein RU07_02090 [Agrobacterium tumefaciens]
MSSSISSLARSDGWDRALEDVASAQVPILPEWGTSDCVMSTCEAIKAVVGVDPLEEFCGRYKTEAGAAKKLRGLGCNHVKDLFEIHIKLELVNRFSARRGDVGVTIINGEFVAGFVCSLGFAIKQPQGTIFLPVSEIAQAYKVGA